MDKKNALFLGFLLVFQDIKPVDPLTGLVVAGTVMAGALRTSTGKVFFGYMLGKFSQTSSGKYLVAHMQDRAKNRLVLRAKEYRELATTKIGAAQAYMLSVAPQSFVTAMQFVQKGFKSTKESFSRNESVHDFNKFREAAASRFSRGFDSESSSEQVNQASVLSSSRFDVSGNKNQYYVFMHNGAQEGKQQFWKGAFFGGIVGAGLTNYIHKKMQKDTLVIQLGDDEYEVS